MDGWRSKRPLCNPSKKPLFFIEKMLRLLEIFLVKNSSPFFSKLVRVRGPNHYILLIGTIKPYNICYWHFLLRSFLSEIFNDPFHQTKKGETNKTVSSDFNELRHRKHMLCFLINHIICLCSSFEEWYISTLHHTGFTFKNLWYFEKLKYLALLHQIYFQNRTYCPGDL